FGKGGRPLPRNLTSNQGLSFFAPTKPPYFVNYRFGDVTSIANIAGQMVTSRKHSGLESRLLRVERKALVSCPTLSERLSISKTYPRSPAPSPRRGRWRFFAAAASPSSLVSVHLRSRYVNLYASAFRPASISPPLNKSNSSMLSKSGSRGSLIVRK